MAKRQPAHTTASAVTSFSNARETINPPENVHLRDRDIPFWHQIVRARSIDTWTDVDLVHAANLAASLSDIEKLRIEIESEGDTIENLRGTMVVNPKHNLLETLSRRAVALSRSLHVHAEATVGKSEDSAKGAKAQRHAKKTLDSADDLIPTFQ